MSSDEIAKRFVDLGEAYRAASQTPRTDAITARMASELDRPMLVADHFIQLCEWSRKLEKELTAAKSALASKEAETEACRRDAERYRWLRGNPEWLGWEHDFRPDEVERQIDVAMASEAMKGGEQG